MKIIKEDFQTSMKQDVKVWLQLHIDKKPYDAINQEYKVLQSKEPLENPKPTFQFQLTHHPSFSSSLNALLLLLDLQIADLSRRYNSEY
ncbi:hypothetical protein ACET3Z_027093 [Daucus carota]